MLLNLLAGRGIDDGGSGLIKVVPGLMIWTLICFGIAFFVLQEIRVRPDPEDDRRAARPDPPGGRGGGQRPQRGARAARAEPRILAQARSESADILAEARKVADAQIERAKAGGRGRAAAPPRGHAQADRGRDRPRNRPDPLARSPTSRSRRPSASWARCSTPRTSGVSSDEAVEGLDFSALEGRAS